MNELRVLSYNIRSMRDDNAALFDVIRRCDPDIVCVQEAPRFLRWRSKCARLARETGLVVLTGGRNAAAMLLLGSLRTKVVYTEDVKLPKRWRLHQRGIAIAVVDVPGEAAAVRVCVASIHLSMNAAERAAQMPMVISHVARVARRADTTNIVIAGDLNERPSGPNWQRLAGQLRDAYIVAPWGGEHTSTAAAPSKRIDGIFVSALIEVHRAGAPVDLPGLARASDHLPVFAVLSIR